MMRHREITATVVAGIDRLLDQQCPRAEIAKRLGVSEYLVGVIAGDGIGRQRRRPPVIVGRKAPTPLRCTDAATVRMAASLGAQDAGAEAYIWRPKDIDLIVEILRSASRPGRLGTGLAALDGSGAAGGGSKDRGAIRKPV